MFFFFLPPIFFSSVREDMLILGTFGFFSFSRKGFSRKVVYCCNQRALNTRIILFDTG